VSWSPIRHVTRGLVVPIPELGIGEGAGLDLDIIPSRNEGAAPTRVERRLDERSGVDEAQAWRLRERCGRVTCLAGDDGTCETAVSSRVALQDRSRPDREIRMNHARAERDVEEQRHPNAVEEVPVVVGRCSADEEIGHPAQHGVTLGNASMARNGSPKAPGISRTSAAESVV